MIKTRVPIPPKTQYEIIYKSAKTCAICRNTEGLQIHHIDQDPSNNNYDNLILICSLCHDQAHTKHDLSQNLDKAKLIDSKNQWEQEVEEKAKKAMTNFHGKSMVHWTYFNFSYLQKYILSLVNYKNDYYQHLLDEKVIDKELNLLRGNPDNNESVYKSIFNNYDFHDRHYLRKYFEDMTNLLIGKVNPYELNAIWSKKEITNLLTDGAFVYFKNGLFFKQLKNTGTRKVHMRAKRISIEAYLYDQNMFGESSYLESFTGHKIAAGFYLVKTVSKSFTDLHLNLTPLALGTGNFEYDTATPYILRRMKT